MLRDWALCRASGPWALGCPSCSQSLGTSMYVPLARNYPGSCQNTRLLCPPSPLSSSSPRARLPGALPSVHPTAHCTLSTTTLTLATPQGSQTPGLGRWWDRASLQATTAPSHVTVTHVGSLVCHWLRSG